MLNFPKQTKSILVSFTNCPISIVVRKRKSSPNWIKYIWKKVEPSASLGLPFGFWQIRKFSKDYISVLSRQTEKCYLKWNSEKKKNKYESRCFFLLLKIFWSFRFVPKIYYVKGPLASSWHLIGLQTAFQTFEENELKDSFFEGTCLHKKK